MDTKTLWIMRHGLAVSEFETDFERALSSTGKQEAKSVAEQIKADGEMPEKMLVSPFKRTQETALVVQSVFEMTTKFETEEMLVHFADHKILGEHLKALDFNKLFIVSHMPIVARLTQYLVDNSDIYGYQTAQAVKIIFDDAGQNRIEKIYLP